MHFVFYEGLQTRPFINLTHWKESKAGGLELQAAEEEMTAGEGEKTRSEDLMYKIDDIPPW